MSHDKKKKPFGRKKSASPKRRSSSPKGKAKSKGKAKGAVARISLGKQSSAGEASQPGQHGVAAAATHKAGGKLQLKVRFNLYIEFRRVPTRTCPDYYDPTTEPNHRFQPDHDNTGNGTPDNAASPAAAGIASASGNTSETEWERPPRWYIVDSGCPYDLTSLNNPVNLDRSPQPAETTICLDTVCGEAAGNLVIPTQVALPKASGGYYQEEAELYCLQGSGDATPDILGLGGRIERGFSFFWDREHGARLYLPGSVKAPPTAANKGTVYLEVIGGVPYLVDHGQGAYKEDGTIFGDPRDSACTARDASTEETGQLDTYHSGPTAPAAAGPGVVPLKPALKTSPLVAKVTAPAVAGASSSGSTDSLIAEPPASAAAESSGEEAVQDETSDASDEELIAHDVGETSHYIDHAEF